MPKFAIDYIRVYQWTPNSNSTEKKSNDSKYYIIGINIVILLIVILIILFIINRYKYKSVNRYKTDQNQCSSDENYDDFIEEYHEYEHIIYLNKNSSEYNSNQNETNYLEILT